MGTNYYFRNKENFISRESKRIEFDSKKNELLDYLYVIGIYRDQIEKIRYEIETAFDDSNPVEMIHIGKRSYGWVPLFQRQTCKFSSVKELKEWWFDKKNSLNYDIVDEYEETLSWDELEYRLINWNKGKDVSSHIEENSDMYFYLDNDEYEWTSGDFS